jgi:hypothetical protein
MQDRILDDEENRNRSKENQIIALKVKLVFVVVFQLNSLMYGIKIANGLLLSITSYVFRLSSKNFTRL